MKYAIGMYTRWEDIQNLNLPEKFWVSQYDHPAGNANALRVQPPVEVSIARHGDRNFKFIDAKGKEVKARGSDWAPVDAFTTREEAVESFNKKIEVVLQKHEEYVETVRKRMELIASRKIV